MDKLFDTADLQQIFQDILAWTQTHTLNLENGVQLSVVTAAFLLSWIMAPTVRHSINWLSDLRGAESWLTVAGKRLSVL